MCKGGYTLPHVLILPGNQFDWRTITSMTWMNSRIPAEQTSREWLEEQDLEKTGEMGLHRTWKQQAASFTLALLASRKGAASADRSHFLLSSGS